MYNTLYIVYIYIYIYWSLRLKLLNNINNYNNIK